MKSHAARMFRHILRISLPAVFVIAGLPLSAQRLSVTGSVVDENRQPLSGVMVQVDGSPRGAVTDREGKFSLQVGEPSSTLRFSYLGYKSQSVGLEGRSSISVTMEPEAQSIDDVVVVGYGSMLKRDLTGAVSSVKGDDLMAIPINNLAAALSGKMAGVVVTTADGAPDATTKIRVRGGGSITQDNSPLYIVDGFPVDNISHLASTDIQSVDVLKDASSTAIYGARGANGVVLITTKSAKAGRTLVTYNGYGQVKHIPRRIEMLDSYEFVMLQHEFAFVKAGGNTEDNVYKSFVRTFGTPDDFDIYHTMPTADYQDMMFGRWAWGQSHNVGITGGSEKTKFSISMTHLDEDAVMVESSLRRTNVNFKLNHQLFKNLRADFNAYYINTNVMGSGTNISNPGEIKAALNYRPTTGMYDGTVDSEGNVFVADEIIYNYSNLRDPMTVVKQDYRRSTRQDLSASAAVSWDIIKGLSWRSDFGMTMRNTNNRRFWGPKTWRSESEQGPIATINRTEAPQWRTGHTLTYNFKDKKEIHSLTAMAGFEAMSEQTTSMTVTTKQLPPEIQPEQAFVRMGYGSRELPETSESTPVRLASFFGRVNYSLLDRYLFSATLRADGSTKFAPGKRWGVFPSAAVAWRISEEGFMKEVKFVDDLKLRFSYGQAGNNRISSDLYRRIYEGVAEGQAARWMTPGMNNIANMFYAKTNNGTLANPNLRWETTVTRNLGLDFSILDNRLWGTVELYLNTTRDLLLSSPVPKYSAYSTQMVNIGQTSNRGIEVSLSGMIVKSRDFNLRATFNIAMNRNRVDRLDGAKTKYFTCSWGGQKFNDDYIVTEGMPVGLMYGFVTDGFYTVDDYDISPAGVWTLREGVANSAPITDCYTSSGMPNPQVGSLKLKKTTPVDPDAADPYALTANDRVIIGNAQPKHTGGFTIAGNWKNLDFSVFLNWSYGNDIYNAQKIYNTNSNQWQYYNMSTEMAGNRRFRLVDDMGRDLRRDPEALAEYNEGASIWIPFMWSYQLHSWAVEDGSFLRINNITVGYTLPVRWTRKVGMSQCRLYATVNNLHVFTKYTGFDPEVDVRGGLTPGLDFSAYPRNRSFTVGTNITF